MEYTKLNGDVLVWDYTKVESIVKDYYDVVGGFKFMVNHKENISVLKVNAWPCVDEDLLKTQGINLELISSENIIKSGSNTVYNCSLQSYLQSYKQAGQPENIYDLIIVTPEDGSYLFMRKMYKLIDFHKKYHLKIFGQRSSDLCICWRCYQFQKQRKNCQHCKQFAKDITVNLYNNHYFLFRMIFNHKDLFSYVIPIFISIIKGT